MNTNIEVNVVPMYTGGYLVAVSVGEKVKFHSERVYAPSWFENFIGRTLGDKVDSVERRAIAKYKKSLLEKKQFEQLKQNAPTN
jgi:hypothetical protein